jgi:hypothetical protein
MVPIVMGPSKENYVAVAPPNSFIHVNDFSSPKELGDFLLALDKDDDKYQKYLEWRRNDKKNWILSHRNPHDFFCRACSLLFYSDFFPPESWPSRKTRFIDVTPCDHTKTENKYFFTH